MDAVILAGGKGLRMGEGPPKPLIVIGGKTIVEHQIDHLLDSKKISKIILGLSYRGQEIIQYIKEKYPSARIDFGIVENSEGTAQTLAGALPKTDSEQILVLNCDDLTDITIDNLATLEENTICISRVRLPFGRVVEKDGYAVFEEKPLINEWVSCGWYVFNRAELEKILPGKRSLERDVFPNMKLRVYRHEGHWHTFNTQKDVDEFEKETQH